MEEEPEATWDPSREPGLLDAELGRLGAFGAGPAPRVLGTLECEDCCRRGAPPLCRHNDRAGDLVLPCDRPTRHGALFCDVHATEEWESARRDGHVAEERPPAPANRLLRPLWESLLSGGWERWEQESDLWAEFEQEWRKLEADINRLKRTGQLKADDVREWEIRYRFKAALEESLEQVRADGVRKSVLQIFRDLRLKRDHYMAGRPDPRVAQLIGRAVALQEQAATERAEGPGAFSTT